ncbi:cytochrome P450 71B37-like isoform X1 [Cynara cardunculus var. scolymus]|nr:cytochrome P450 71B37-like isoform X1 [Cynara cardunculus var. scolymus]
MDILTFFPSWFLPTVVVLFFSCIYVYALRWKNSSMAAPKLPPGPPGLPILGNFHQILSKGLQEILWDLSHKYGPVMLIHLGTQPFLIISSTEMATQVLKTHDLEMCTRPVSQGSKRLSFNYMDVAFTPHSDHWRDMRKVLVSEYLGAKRTRLFKKALEVEVEGLVHALSSTTTANLDDMMLNLVYDVVCKVALGKSYREEMFNGKTLKEIVEETVLMLSGSFSDIFPTFGWILDELRGWNRRLDRCFSDFDGILQMIIDEHVDRKATAVPGDHENDLIDDYLPRLTTDEIKGILMNVLNGAIDTTTITMVWAMSEIFKNPRIMQKLQNEIRSCVGANSRVDESDITQMKYLKMVVKETLRLHPPPAFLIARECMKRCEIGGYDVLPGTKVLVNSWGIGRDSRVWKEKPTEFRPERFETVEVDFGGKHFEMTPFGGGRRACPGYNQGTSTVEFTIANLLYWFDWKTPDGKKNEDLDMEESGMQLVHRKTPLCLVPIKHNWQQQ